MPLLFLVVGLVLIVTVIRGTVGTFASQLKADASGGYLKWVAAIIIIGAMGYATPLKEPSRYLLALLALVVFITSGSGFIDAFVSELNNPGSPVRPTPPGGNANLPSIPVQTQQGGGGTTQTSGSGSTGPLGGGSSNFLQTAAAIAPFAIAAL